MKKGNLFYIMFAFLYFILGLSFAFYFKYNGYYQHYLFVFGATILGISMVIGFWIVDGLGLLEKITLKNKIKKGKKK